MLGVFIRQGGKRRVGHEDPGKEARSLRRKRGGREGRVVEGSIVLCLVLYGSRQHSSAVNTMGGI